VANARRVIDEAANFLHAALVAHSRLGACVDISGILFRTLEEEGIWSCGVKGSLTINFPRSSRIRTRYFWSADHGDFVAGHAWLFAPPYTVVDIAVRQQPYRSKEKRYIPERVLTTNDVPVPVDTDDIVSPSARAELMAHGVPPDRHLEVAARYEPGRPGPPLAECSRRVLASGRERSSERK
jgi:hypothetical protein